MESMQVYGWHVPNLVVPARLFRMARHVDTQWDVTVDLLAHKNQKLQLEQIPTMATCSNNDEGATTCIVDLMSFFLMPLLAFAEKTHRLLRVRCQVAETRVPHFQARL